MRIVTPLVVAGVVAGILRALRKRGPAPREELRFRAPPGQDPAAVLGALRRARIEAEPRLVDGETEVVISCRPGDRERVRTVVQGATRELDQNPIDGSPVRFMDE